MFNNDAQIKKEFERHFPSERKCAEYLAHLRWPEGILCPRCRTDRPWLSVKRDLFICRRRKCQFHFSGRTGTIFKNSKVSLHRWFNAIWRLADLTGALAPADLRNLLGLSKYESALKWYRRLSRQTWLRPLRSSLEGTVDVRVGSFPYLKKKGRSISRHFGKDCIGPQEQLIAKNMHMIVAVSTLGRRIRLKRLPTCNQRDVLDFIHESVARRSRLVTSTDQIFADTLKVNYTHKIGAGIRAKGVFEEMVLFIQNSKRIMKLSDLDLCLKEFAFRASHKRPGESPKRLFDEILRRMIEL